MTENIRGELLNGKTLANKLREQLSKEIMENPRANKHPPHLVAILVGYDGPSQVYIRHKRLACDQVGIMFSLYHLADKITTEQLLEVVWRINEDERNHGCIVQLPLPEHIDSYRIIEALDPTKDVDGFHPLNIGKMNLNHDCLVAATPYGIKLILEHYEISTKGKHIVILGKSLIVGQPLSILLANEKSAKGTVTVCDQYTSDISIFTRIADIIVVATGVHHLLKDPEQIKDGVVIVDVGIHQIPDDTKKRGYRLEGDVDFHALKDKASYITPVPGGVGPMTVASLLLNTWKAYQQEKY